MRFVRRLFAFVLLALVPLAASAQDPAEEDRAVALIRFRGDDAAMVEGFGEVLLMGMIWLDGFAPVVVDMGNLPPDVPEGGFPPFVNPGPSMTGGIPLALTGEITLDDVSGMSHLRLFLWDVMENSLLFSDEMAAEDREALAQVMPAMLEWMFSRIADGELAVIVDGTLLPVVRGEVRTWWESRLYLGFRVGWAVHLYEPLWQDAALRDAEANWRNALVAIQVDFPFMALLNDRVFGSGAPGFLDGLGLRVEAVAALDSGSRPDEGAAFSMTFPILLRYEVPSRSPLFVAAFGGIYAFAPFGTDFERRNQFYFNEGLRLGYALGINLGNRAAGGRTMVDLRWQHDLFGSLLADLNFFRRSQISVSVGHEFGFWNRN